MENTEGLKYQVVFRTRRGGSGLDYSVVRAEFFALFEEHIQQVVRELPGRFRLWVRLDLPPRWIAHFARHLGYTEAILSVWEEPWEDLPRKGQERGRWWIGWIRRGDCWVYQKEIYVQDTRAWIRESPHLRPLKVEDRGVVVERFGHRNQRGLSPLDAKFLLNVTPVPAGSFVLDPFAGFGGIVLEGKRRGLRMIASDWEPRLAPGLREICPDHYVIADARHLPFATGTFDAVVSEPPYRTSSRQSVLDALPEIHRVAIGGPLTLLVAEDMVDPVTQKLAECSREKRAEYWIRRNRGLRCAALCFG